ncbi:MAG: hypothetical protein V4574_12850 [Pseudomonadota bacterium]
MVFGLFDPPQTKAQKRAASSAQSLREQAVRDMLIELRILIGRQEQARQLQLKLFSADHEDAAMTIAAAIAAAQETIDRVGRFNESFPRELADLKHAAVNGAGFEALASFELEGRDFMMKVRDEAKAQLVPLGVMIMEARQSIGG